jgi:HlyD family secretion protein
VETGRRDSALVMPLAALQAQAGEGAATALVAVDGRAQPRNLRLGLRTLDAVEVLEGLAAGDAVLLGGKVQPDAKVRPQTVGWQPGQPMATVGATGKGGEAGSAMSNAMGR